MSVVLQGLGDFAIAYLDDILVLVRLWRIIYSIWIQSLIGCGSMT